MPTPTKRQRKNDYVPSQQPVRSLDFFFSKPKKDQELKSRAAQGSENDPPVRTSPTITPLEEQELGSTLTDEELARKLQEEWNNEDQGGGVDPSSASSVKEPLGDASEAEASTNSQRSTDLEVTKNNGFTKPLATSSVGSKNTLSLQSASSTEDSTTTSMPFDEHPLTFDPSKYIPQLREHWAAHGGNASYGLLTRAFVLINSTQSRIKIVDTLVNFLRTIIEGDPDSLLSAVRFSYRKNFTIANQTF